MIIGNVNDLSPEPGMAHVCEKPAHKDSRVGDVSVCPCGKSLIYLNITPEFGDAYQKWDDVPRKYKKLVKRLKVETIA